MNRVFFMHPRWQKGGVETTNERWAAILAEENFEPIAVSYKAELDALDMMPLINCKNLANLLIYILKNVAKQDTLLICQSYYILKVLPIILFLKFKGCRVILTERNSFDQYNEFTLKKKVYAVLFPWIFLIFHKIILNSSEMADEKVYKRCRNNVLVFQNPRFTKEDLSALKAAKCQKISNSVYTFCRWSDQKDPEFIIKAAKIFSDNSVDFSVFCNAQMYPFQRPFVPSAFLYMLENPSILFFCSKFEGYPNLLLEARVIGLPIVYSHCNTGVKEILDGYPLAYRFDKKCLKSLKEAYALAAKGSENLVSEPDIELALKHSEYFSDAKIFSEAFNNAQN
jgi:glycosyltransferase involved in cell wall biosynthesis